MYFCWPNVYVFPLVAVEVKVGEYYNFSWSSLEFLGDLGLEESLGFKESVKNVLEFWVEEVLLI